MRAPDGPDAAPLFNDLIAWLRGQGFVIGVDQYLRLHTVLDRLEGEHGPERLRTLLCPLFATTREQQERFYQAFDDFLRLQPAAKLSEVLPEAAPGRRGWVRSCLARCARILALAVVLILVCLWLVRSSQQPAQVNAPRATVPEPAAAPLPPKADGGPAAPSPVVAADRGPQGFRGGSILPAVAFGVPLLLFGLRWWYESARRSLVVTRNRIKRPPHTWPITVASPPPPIYAADQLAHAARVMRRRSGDGVERLDVPATVAATLQAGGYPALRFRTDTRMPEYLVLVDRASFRDHQARLFCELARVLEREEVFAACYVFDGDPRVCVSEGDGRSVYLGDLQHQLTPQRLLVFSTGEGLIDPITGRLFAWAGEFSGWQERILLTPEPASSWGLREVVLAGLFTLAPATIDGLTAALDVAEAGSAAPSTGERGEAPGAGEGAEAVGALKGYLGADVFEWLCACAVYPELHWDLTLYLASLPGMPPGLVSEENLLRLIRVPGFRTGTLPPELRWRLVAELPRDRELTIRRALIELMEAHPPPENAFAADAFRLQLAIMRWTVRRDRRSRRQLVDTIRSLPRSQVLSDYTVVRLMERARVQTVDVRLPSRLKRIFYREDVPALGVRFGVQLAAALAAACLAGNVTHRATENAMVLEHVHNDVRVGPARVAAGLRFLPPEGAAANGYRLRPGELIVTGPGGRAQIRMGDGSRILIGEKSWLIVLGAAYAPREPSRTRSFRLVKGEIFCAINDRPSLRFELVLPGSRAVLSPTTGGRRRIEFAVEANAGSTMITPTSGIPPGRIGWIGPDGSVARTEDGAGGILTVVPAADGFTVRPSRGPLTAAQSLRYGRRALQLANDDPGDSVAGLFQAIDDAAFTGIGDRLSHLALVTIEPEATSQRAAARARAVIAMQALSLALEQNGAGYPATLNLQTLAELHPSQELREQILGQLKGRRLEFYRRLPNGYEAGARENDRAGTPIVLRNGRIAVGDGSAFP